MHPVDSDYVKHVYSEEQKYWYNFACFIKFCIFFFFLESGDSCISCAVSVILHFMFIYLFIVIVQLLAMIMRKLRNISVSKITF